MKYLTIGVSVLAILICLCVLFGRLSDQYLDETEAPLREMTQYFPLEDYGAIRLLAEEAQEIWDARKGFFSSLLSHNDLEQANDCFASLLAYAEREEMAELRDAYRRLLVVLEHLREMDQPTYYNILWRIVNQLK